MYYACFRGDLCLCKATQEGSFNSDLNMQQHIRQDKGKDRT